MQHNFELKICASVSPEQLQAIGNGVLAYVKPIAVKDAALLLGQPIAWAPNRRLFALYNANGAPISISKTFAAALGDAMQHELTAAMVN